MAVTNGVLTSRAVVRPSVGPRAEARRSHGLLGWTAGALVAAVANAVAFWFVRPDVGDLQAALARESAARNGVGLGYMFNWFSGGATPGNYSVIVPALSGLIGAALLGVLATVALTPLVAWAARGTAHPAGAVVVATIVDGASLWSGRIPFALGTLAAVAAVVALRARRTWTTLALTVVSCFCSPVTGAFLALLLGAAFLVERSRRRLLWPPVVVVGATLIGVALYFGTPGAQPFPLLSALLLASLASVWMFWAAPPPAVRLVLWLTAIAAPLLSVIPNGMGSNWNRLPLIWLPVVVVALARARWWRVVLAVLPAVIMCLVLTGIDLSRASVPAARASYYTPLIHQLGARHDLANHRLEVVGDSGVHTAAYALLPHAALAGGYETQEQNELNSVLLDPKRLDAVSYKVWLDNNAVGYVALSRRASAESPEYDLVSSGELGYLRPVSSDARWTLFQVRDAVPIVQAPARLVRAGQASMTISVPCACRVPLRIHYSHFLQVRDVAATGGADRREPIAPARAVDDGTGWTVVHVPSPGRYVLSGNAANPLR